MECELLRGPEGPQGPQGPQGVQGPQGDIPQELYDTINSLTERINVLENMLNN